MLNKDKPICIAAIGAGVIGLSTVQKLLQDIPNIQVTVFTDQISPNTTGDLSGGLVYPYKVGHHKNIKRWLEVTIQHLTTLHKLPNAFEMGIQPTGGYILNTKLKEVQEVFSFAQKDSEKDFYFLPSPDATRVWINTWTCHCVKYLPWLSEQIKKLGGKFVFKQIHSFEELCDYDMIVNCTGISALDLTDDKKLVPLRGQVTIVKAPWIKHFVIDGLSYILPRLEDVILGGTSQKGNFSLKVDPNDSKDIWEKCCKLNTSLKYSEVIGERVGLRPYREEIRLEIEMKNLNGKLVPILHNYGHSGGGVSIHWGCAVDASLLVQEFFNKRKMMSHP